MVDIFTILTDHKPLERIFGPKTTIPSLAAMGVQRWAIKLSAFDYSIIFIPLKQTKLLTHYHDYPCRQR